MHKIILHVTGSYDSVTDILEYVWSKASSPDLNVKMIGDVYNVDHEKLVSDIKKELSDRKFITCPSGWTNEETSIAVEATIMRIIKENIL